MLHPPNRGLARARGFKSTSWASPHLKIGGGKSQFKSTNSLPSPQLLTVRHCNLPGSLKSGWFQFHCHRKLCCSPSDGHIFPNTPQVSGIDSNAGDSKEVLSFPLSLRITFLVKYKGLTRCWTQGTLRPCAQTVQSECALRCCCGIRPERPDTDPICRDTQCPGKKEKASQAVYKQSLAQGRGHLGAPTVCWRPDRPV